MMMYKVNAMGSTLVFDGLRIYSQESGKTTIWGIPVEQIGYKKIENEIFAAYQAQGDSPFAQVGEPLPRTILRVSGCVSSSSLSDATIYKLAFHPQKGVVSRCATSYWVSDRDDIPNWKHRLLQHEEWLDAPLLVD